MPQIRCVDLLGQYWPQICSLFWEKRRCRGEDRRSRASSVTTDAEEMDRTVLAAMCLHGFNCREGSYCARGHTDEQKQLFAEKKRVREKEWMAPCSFCAVGCCWYGANCLRTLRSRFSETVYTNQRPATAESESDYASAESGSDSGDDSAGEAEMAGSAGCGSEGAVLDGVLIPFLSEDFTKVVKGWRPKVSSAVVKGEYRGFGEPSVYWMLDYVELPALPPAILDCVDVSDRCEVDAVGFVFQKSEGAAMSQKAQRRFARQKKRWRWRGLDLRWCVISGLSGEYRLDTVVQGCGRLSLRVVTRIAVTALVIAVVVGLRVGGKCNIDSIGFRACCKNVCGGKRDGCGLRG